MTSFTWSVGRRAWHRFEPKTMKAVLSALLFFGIAVLGHAQQAPLEVTIEAYVDGPSSLRFTQSGFSWRNGPNSKPGRHNGKNEPTYVNGKAWMPKWNKNGQDSGEDFTETFPWRIPNVDLTWEVVAVGTER